MKEETDALNDCVSDDHIASLIQVVGKLGSEVTGPVAKIDAISRSVDYDETNIVSPISSQLLEEDTSSLNQLGSDDGIDDLLVQAIDKLGGNSTR